MKYFVFSLKILIVLVLLGLLNTRYKIQDTAFAEGVSLKVQPATFSIRATPPADIRAPFSIENPGDEPVELTILFKGFRDRGDGTGALIYSNPQMTSDNDMFLKNVQVLDNSLGIRTVTIGPKQKKQLELQIPAIESGDRGDHYFSIVFLTRTEALRTITNSMDENNSFSLVQSGIAIPVLLSLGQTSERNTFITDFSAPLFLQKGPVPLRVKVKNSSEHFSTVTGVIFIKNMFGQTVGKITLPKENILSGSTRIISTYEEGDSGIKANEKGDIMWSEKLLFGLYTATLTLAITPEQSLYTRSVYFLAFPAVGFVFLFFILILGISMIIRIKKKLSQE